MSHDLPAVPDEQRKRVCRPGEGALTCRYLVIGSGGFECAKNSALRWTIDERVASMTAKGDNCIGIVPPHKPITGKRGTWEEDGDSYPVEVLADNTDAEGLKFSVRVTGGDDAGRTWDGFVAWSARGMGLWRFTLDTGETFP